MEINALVKNVEIVNKGKYQYADVQYESDGKQQQKKIMSFGPQAKSFITLKNVQMGEKLAVTIEKNSDGYWDWVKVVRGEANPTKTPSSGVSPSPAPNRGNYETSEERFHRQIYIVRQSSISSAIEYLNHVKKSYEMSEILTVASEFEEYVFGKSAKKDSPVAELIAMEDDIPL